MVNTQRYNICIRQSYSSNNDSELFHRLLELRLRKQQPLCQSNMTNIKELIGKNRLKKVKLKQVWILN